MTTWDDRFDSRPVTWILAFTVGAVLVLWLMVMGVFGLRVATAGIVGAGQAKIQIQSAPFRIAAYQSFFNQCASIQGLEARLDDAFAQLATTTDPERVRTNIAGIQGLRGEAIAKYNADARKEYTEGQFRDSDLPFAIPAGAYVQGGKHTSCGSN